MSNGIDFPVGYYQYNNQKVFNYQMNRWHSLGMAKHEDMLEMGKRIKKFADWKREFGEFAQAAEKEGRLLNSAIYYRASEFYTMHDQEEKRKTYRKFMDVFYEAVKNETFIKEYIPYEKSEMPILRFSPSGEKKGTILMHGGFDSFQEEWFFIMKSLSMNGYEVIGFEGPGQGHLLIEQEIPLDYRWEKPVKCILDHYAIEEASIFGLSMGGWFAVRATANEPRIKNAIVSGHAVDYSRIPPDFARSLMMFFIKNMRNYTAKSFEKMSRKEGIQGWQTYQLSHITKLSPIEAFEYSLGMNALNLGCEKITQNVLYLTGEDDHFVPMKMHDWQVQLLKNCKSLTDKVYSKETHAQNHCLIGNVGLMLHDILLWLDHIDMTT